MCYNNMYFEYLNMIHNVIFDLHFLGFLQINTCNGFYCDYFSPNKAYKPKMWTEAWTGW